MPAAPTVDQATPWWLGPDAPQSLADLVVHHASAHPSRRVMSRWTSGQWHPVTAAELREQVEDLAAGLVAAGVQPGQRVALMAKTRYEWTVTDLAIWAAGAVGVPVYESSSAEQVRWILADADVVAAVVEHRTHAGLVDSVREQLPNLGPLWLMDDTRSDDRATLAGLAAAGRAAGEPGRAELARRRAALSRDTVATIIYTSGTTGRPKGVELTHGNFLAEVSSAIEFLPELFADPDASTLLFLPLAHVFARMIQVAVVMNGVHTGHSDVARITRDLPTFRPTFVLAVPRVFERVFDGARRKAVKDGRGKVFDAAVATAIGYSKALDTRRGPSPLLRAKHAVFSRLVYGRIKAALGGRVDVAVSGGAALGSRLGHFFRGVGVTVLEGYGLTETTAACTVNNSQGQRIGSVGRPLPGFEARIGDGGEVQVRGAHVFAAYHGDPEASAGVLSPDGWFRTGDLGSIDADGFLTISGRAKEIIVTSAGKNVSPAPLEDVLRSSPLVSQAMVLGDGRAQVTALMTLDAEGVAAWAEQNGRDPRSLAEAADDPDLRAEVRTVVDEANAGVSSAERIARFSLLDADWSEQSGHLTPSMKLKRAVVARDFAEQIEALYPRHD